jgi:hypothetical protein
MALLPVWPSTRPPPAAAAAMPTMASIPQGGRPVPFRLSPEAFEAMRQASQQYMEDWALHQLQDQLFHHHQPQVFDITMDDAPENIDPVLREDRAKELTIRLYDHIINIARGMSLDKLMKFKKDFEDNDLKDGINEIHEYMERPDVYGDIKETPLLEAIKKLVDGNFITQLRKDLNTLVSTLQGASQSSSSSSQAIVPQPQPPHTTKNTSSNIRFTTKTNLTKGNSRCPTSSTKTNRRTN